MEEKTIGKRVIKADHVNNINNFACSSLYDAYVNANIDNLENLAIIAMDGNTKYSHKELLNMVNSATIGFWSIGIGNTSKVGILTNNTIEEAVSLLALNRLGAIAFFVDISKGVSDIRKSIKSRSIDLLIIDEFLLPMESDINEEGIPIVIVNQTKPYGKGMPFNDLYRCENGLIPPPEPIKDNRIPAVIINSSGTTGSPKPIVHTSYSINMAAYKILCTDYPLTRENVIMKIIPSHIGLGLITTLYTALLSGTPIVLIEGNNPQQSITNTTSFIGKFPMFRDNVGLDVNAKLIIFAAPMFFRVIAEKNAFFDDLSYIGAMLAAGSKMGRDELEILHQKLGKLHCPVKICNGYGQNEMCGAVTLNSNSINKEGSAGVPVKGTEIRIVDPETMELVNTNQIGLILERSDTLFLCYENMQEATEKAMVTLKDGTVWFNSKDLGYLDEDGFLFITGRISRVLLRYDCKISIDRIEEKIKLHPAVLDCAVVVTKQNKIEEVPVAYVSLVAGITISEKTLLSEIQESQHPLSEMEYIDSWIILPQLPYMKNGKVDYLALEELAKTIAER